MNFLKIGDIILNTNYIAAVELNADVGNEDSYVVVVMGAVEGTFKGDTGNLELKEFRFSGKAAEKIRHYFSDPTLVNHLL
ncbi:hypothetical protein [Phormidium sp. CCY1219]|uniref:hypothetical protein n=1 Tax=Phormidium sp. CCY1219 TaxID=2886104 RepID=UPI002D1EE028|nr:hypothetical protein [Phormidium sp. CCY1219]MEB3829203.1 hypothetical protein [Phormidium sp. CCY1219]